MVEFIFHTLRTAATQKRYDEVRQQRALQHNVPCPLCNEDTTKEFTYWYIIKNAFPYDLIAKQHDLLLPKEHIQEDKISKAAWQEFFMLKNGYLNEVYDLIIEPLNKNKSLPNHFHLHLIVQNKSGRNAN